MDIYTVKSHIQTKKPNSYYIFTGPETEVMNIYINQLAKVLNATVKRPDSLADLSDKAHSASMIPQRVVYVIRDDNEFLKDEYIRKKVIQPGVFGNDILIFVYTSIDKRSKLHKEQKDNIVEFEPLPESVLIKYIQREINLSTENCRKLIEVCESSYSRILLEIDKIKHYPNRGSVDKSFKELMTTGAIYNPPYEAMFDFVHAVLTNKVERAFNLLEQSYATNTPTMAILANLYNSTKHLLQVQTCPSANVIEVTGLTPFQVKLAKGRVGYNSVETLVRLLRLVRSVEKGIKIGEIDESIAVASILTKLWV